MSANLHALSLVLAIILVFVWLQIPAALPYSLQAVVLSFLLYFVIKRLKKTKLWYIAPTRGTLEMPLLTFGFLLLIASTGNLDSIFFPMSYAHLFFLVLTCSLPVILVATAGLMVFHFAMVVSLTPTAIAQILSLPLLMTFFLFAKFQYDHLQTETRLLKREQARLAESQTKQTSAEQFLAEYLQPKLLYLQELAKYPENNRELLQRQLSRLQLEMTKIIKKLD